MHTKVIHAKVHIRVCIQSLVARMHTLVFKSSVHCALIVAIVPESWEDDAPCFSAYHLFPRQRVLVSVPFPSLSHISPFGLNSKLFQL